MSKTRPTFVPSPWLTRRALLIGGVATILSPSPSRAEGGTGSITGAITRFRQGWFRKKPLRNHSDVVVYVEGNFGSVPAPSTAAHEIHQINKEFLPAVSAVVVGTTVGFPNDDKIFHNVFSLSKAASFDLGLYKSGSSKLVTMERPGVVNVYCNIHPEMAAYVVVLENNFFAVTQKDGAFKIDGLPAGRHSIVAWQPHGDPYRGEVEVVAGGTAQVAIELLEEKTSSDHTRKDGTPYGRYR